MAGNDTLTLSADAFEQDVLQSDQPVLVDFWAEWCAPCRALTPTIDTLATEFSGRVRIGKLNVDGAASVAQQYGVTSIPTLILFQNGEPVERVVGVRGEGELRDLLEGVAQTA